MDDNTQYQDPQGDLDVPEKPLEQDYDTPAAPPSDIPADRNIGPEHPETDTNVDDHEKYDVGSNVASGAGYQHGDSEEEAERIA